VVFLLIFHFFVYLCAFLCNSRNVEARPLTTT
jgi:hypothetical protein